MIINYFWITLVQITALLAGGFSWQVRLNAVSWMSSSVCVLIIFPSKTNQWSLFSLNFWPSQKVEEPPVQFDITNNPISRVLNFFPIPVQEECLSQGKRLRGICMNTYECRIKGGSSRGRCALGFGVCCVFMTSCNGEVQNNLTYVISPGFPNLIDWPMNCSVVVRKIDRQVSQLRIDFVHFNIGQPNTSTGICDEDIMEIRNGESVFQMCGWNSGQHVYIDLDEDEPVMLNFKLPSRLQSRMWEMKIVQLVFEQRAPTGCLQYFETSNGTLKTLNYLSNGRYLANHDYLLCIRQEKGMCGISYAPCHANSFRIGLRKILNMTLNVDTVNRNTTIAATNPQMQSMNNSIGSTNNGGIDEEGSGTNPMDQEVSSSTTSSTGQERCRDRILIPCDFEEFITPGNNEAGICNLEHCGNTLCDENELDKEGNCHVETWATPFRIRVAFGPGQDTGTTLEDNIGMCLVYEQLPCV